MLKAACTTCHSRQLLPAMGGKKRKQEKQDAEPQEREEGPGRRGQRGRRQAASRRPVQAVDLTTAVEWFLLEVHVVDA